MLTILTAQPVHPEVETIDRDPGIITLLAALVRSAVDLRVVARAKGSACSPRPRPGRTTRADSLGRHGTADGSAVP